MSALSAVGEPRPVRVILREFITHVVEGEDEIDLDELVMYASRRFADDDEFTRAAARDVLPILVAETLRLVIRDHKESVVKTQRGWVSKKNLDLTARERLAQVFEGSGNGYRSFLAMRKPHLLALNARDEQHIESMAKWVDFRAELAGRLNDLQVVGDLPSRVLEEVWKKHLEPEQAS